MAAWCTAQARIIARFSESAAGGTLVLCASYVQVQALGRALVAEGISPGRIIENSGQLAVDQAKYTVLYRQGTRPLWLALGPAWTGLDLADPEAADPAADHLLSDLVITRIPLGLNRSVTQEARQARNFQTTAFDALLRLKQGLGRLIRRADLKNRRLFILDGRLTCDVALNNTFTKHLVRDVFLLIRQYKKTMVITE